ncbi:uncharacterized protein [Tiliqua scincoides]|uniref:uncharacterized protein n=1 Tax=Tiliqua scincoides TaxID=71010 RepID=UPI003462C17D
MAGEAEDLSGCSPEGGAAGQQELEEKPAGGEGSAAPEAGGSPLEEAPDSSEERACRICYNFFDRGRHASSPLRCLHAFCLECLSRLQQPHADGPGVSITCPLCRQRTVLPDGRLLALAGQGEAASPLPPLQPLLPPRAPSLACQQRPLQEQSSAWTTPLADAGAATRAGGSCCGCCHQRWKPPDLFGSKRWLLAYFLFVIVLSAVGGIGLYRLNFGPGYILLTASIFFLSVAWCFKGATEMTAEEALLRSRGSAAACQSQASEDRTSCTRATGGWDC